MAPRGVDAPDGTKGAFLAAIALGLSQEKAAQLADIAVSTIHKWRLVDDEFAADLAAAYKVRGESRADKGWDAVMAILNNPDHAKHFDAAKFAVERNEAAVVKHELSGPDAGPMEVNHPDVAAAINAFTQRVIAATTGGRTELAHAAASGPGESPARIPVAELDRPSEPGGTAG